MSSDYESIVEIQNPASDVHSECTLGEDGEMISGGDSYLSLPLNKINIPEIRNIKGTFVYNYFVKDERVKRSGTESPNKILNLQSDSSSEILFQERNNRLPRYVRLSFKPPLTNGVLRKATATDYIENNLDKIFMEGRSSNKYFTGIEFSDTGKEKFIYNLFNNALFTFNPSQSDKVDKNPAELLYSVLNEKGGLHGDDKRLVKEYLGNISQQGYVLAPSDIPHEIARSSNDPLHKQKMTVQFNNLVMADLINNSTRIEDKVFQDEMRAIKTFSYQIKQRTLGNPSYNPQTVTEDDYDLTFIPVSIKPSPAISNDEDLHGQYPKIKFAGYLIQKYEVNKNGDLTFIGHLYSSDTDNLNIVDRNVRYGGNYIYRVRTICEIELVAEITPDDPAKYACSDIGIAKILVASQGKSESVFCVEKKPPKPPENLRVGFDFRRKIPFLSWQFPFNKQRDIKRFQIFKRQASKSNSGQTSAPATKQPFTLVAELDFDNSVIRSGVHEVAIPENLHRFKSPKVNFLDTTYKVGDQPIYTIASVDAHGMSSNYGAQIQVKYNKRLNKIDTTLVSRPGAPKPYPNLLLNSDAFEDAIKISGYERMRVFFDPEYYKVFRSEMIKEGIEKGEQVEKTVNFIMANPDKDTYKMHIINLDLQKDEIVNIRIIDASGQPISSPPANFSVETLEFS